MSTSDEIRARIAFDTTLLELTETREAAYETRDADREGWKAAKQAHAEWRTAMKELAEAAGTRKGLVAVSYDNEEN